MFEFFGAAAENSIVRFLIVMWCSFATTYTITMMVFYGKELKSLQVEIVKAQLLNAACEVELEILRKINETTKKRGGLN
jgi:hypothetical protein